MVKQITEEQKKRIFEAHKLEMSTYESAEYSGVSSQTVRNYWKEKGLKPHYKFKGQQISENKIDKIFEAHKLEMSILESSEYAEVSERTVHRYWKKEGLKPHYGFGESRISRIPTTLLLDGVFDIKNKPEQTLSLEEIKDIVEYKLGSRVHKKSLEKQIQWLTDLGYYEKFEENNEIKYRAGMPRAMGGLLEEL